MSSEPLATPTRQVATTRIVAVRGKSLEFRADRVVGEEPLEIRAAGPGQDPVAVAVTLRTPGFEDELAMVDAVTAADVRRVAGDILSGPMQMAVIGPFAKSAAFWTAIS